MMRTSICMALLACLIVLTNTSCRKKGKDLTEVTFVNRVNKKVTLDIYATMDDYGTNSNRVLRRTLAANETITLPGKTFKEGQDYYIDWYTDDHYYSNWHNDKFKLGDNYVAFRPVVGNNTFYTSDADFGYKQAVFLDTVLTQTKWRAVNVYQYSAASGYKSIWDQLPDADRFKEITVRKNFTATILSKDANNVEQTTQVEFKVHESKEAYIEFINTSYNNIGSMIGGRLPTGTPPEYSSNARDTVMALLPGSDYNYMMVRD